MKLKVATLCLLLLVAITLSAGYVGSMGMGGRGGAGLEIGQRYHNIHTMQVGLECSNCHISEYAPDYVYQRKYKLPVRGAPGPVDRGICLGCHKENGPTSKKFYGTAGG